MYILELKIFVLNFFNLETLLTALSVKVIMVIPGCVSGCTNVFYCHTKDSSLENEDRAHIFPLNLGGILH